MKHLLVCLALVALAAPAAACINDAALPAHEREFRSQYRAAPAPAPAPAPSDPYKLPPLAWAGAGLLVGAAVVCLGGRRGG